MMSINNIKMNFCRPKVHKWLITLLFWAYSWLVALCGWWNVSAILGIFVTCCIVWLMEYVSYSGHIRDLLHCVVDGMWQLFWAYSWLLALCGWWNVTVILGIFMTCCIVWLMECVSYSGHIRDLLHCVVDGMCHLFWAYLWLVALCGWWNVAVILGSWNLLHCVRVNIYNADTRLAISARHRCCSTDCLLCSLLCKCALTFCDTLTEIAITDIS